MLPRRVLVLFLTILAALPQVAPVASAASGDCGTNMDQQGDAWALPMSSATAGGCDGKLGWTVGEPVADDDSFVWPIHRGWDIVVTLTLLDPGEAEITRHVGTTLVESASGSGTLVLDENVDLYLSDHDRALSEVIRISSQSTPATEIRYELRVTHTPSSAIDCGGTDASSAASTPLTSGVPCAGRFVDGWVEHASLADRYDAFTIPVTTGNVVTVDLTARGHSMGLNANGGGINVGNTVRPTLWGTGAFTTTLRPTANATLILSVQTVLPDKVERYVPEQCGGWYCVPAHWEVIDVYDSRSTGPFEYTLQVNVVRNSPPAFTITDFPSGPLFAGDRARFNMTITDPDGDLVRPLVATGSTTNLVPVTPVNASSGTTWPIESGVLQYSTNVYVDAADAWNVETRPGTSTTTGWERRSLAVYPADCGTFERDAPPTGRVISGSCAGWVGAGIDEEDILLVTTSGGQDFSLRSMRDAVLVDVTAPDGSPVRVLDGYHRHWSATAGEYVIRVRPGTDTWASYDLRAALTDAPAPDGVLVARQSASFVQTHGDVRPTGTFTFGEDGSATKRFDVPAWALENATAARLWVYARASACQSVVAFFSIWVNGAFAASLDDGDLCARFPTTDSWVPLDLPPQKLVAGVNDINIHTHDYYAPTVIFSLADGGDASRSWWNGGSASGTRPLAWALEIESPGAAAATPSSDRGIVLRLTQRATDHDDATAVVTWNDGAPAASTRLAWGREGGVIRGGLAAGPLTATASGATLSGVPLQGASASWSIVTAGDCGSQRDAPETGAPFGTTCLGHLGYADDEDALLFAAPAGKKLSVTVDNATFDLVAPDGTLLSGETGTARDYAVTAGTWRVLVRNPTPGAMVDYAARVTLTTMTAPTGAVVLAAPRLLATGANASVTVQAMDMHLQDVSVDLDWGDGRVTSSPLAPTSTTPRTFTHSYSTPGSFVLRASGAAQDGRPLAATNATLLVVTPDDCGAGEAPDKTNYQAAATTTVDAEGYPVVGAGVTCYGSVDGEDRRDLYEVRFPAFSSYAVRIRPGVGLGVGVFAFLTAQGSLHANVGQSSGTFPGAFTITTAPDGTITVKPWTSLENGGSLVLAVDRVSGAGVYEMVVDGV